MSGIRDHGGTPEWFGAMILGECGLHGPHVEPTCPECPPEPACQHPYTRYDAASNRLWCPTCCEHV